MKQELLLSLLETNARYSTRDLADILLEDEDSVIHTMNELEKKKIICGYQDVYKRQADRAYMKNISSK